MIYSPLYNERDFFIIISNSENEYFISTPAVSKSTKADNSDGFSDRVNRTAR